MKPVPIAQYLDHIGRLAQADAESPRREATPFKPRAIHVVGAAEPRAPLAFGKPLRPAPASPRPPDANHERGEGEARSSGREPAFARPPKGPTAEEIEARVNEAYERGVREGKGIGRAEEAEAFAHERAIRQEQELVERLDFQVNEYAQLAETVETGLVEIEERLAATMARIVAPLLGKAISTRVVDELHDNIGRLRVGGAPGLIRIRGPEHLLGALHDRLSCLPVDVEFIEEDSVEATIEVQDTVIRSELQPWADLIASLIV